MTITNQSVVLNKRYFATVVLWILCLPLSSIAIEPVFKTDFDQSDLQKTGWTAISAGFGAYAPASVSVGMIPSTPADPTLTNGRGVIITALSGQGSFVYGPAIPTNGELMVLRVSVFSLGQGGAVAAGALDAAPGGSLSNVDGSLSYSLEADSGSLMADYQRLTMLYRPKSKAMIPFFQLAVAPSSDMKAVTIMLDNFEIYSLNAATVADPNLRALFDIGGGAAPTATSTPKPPNPTATPTATPAPQAGVYGELYTITDPNDALDVSHPRAAFDYQKGYAIASVELGDYKDIGLRWLDASNKSVSGPFIVNQTYENTEANDPDINVDGGGIRHIAWSDNRSIEKLSSIYLAQLDSSGNRLVTNDYEVNLLFQDTNAKLPALALENNGDMITCWSDNRNYLNDLFARRLRWDGKNITAIDAKDFQVNLPYNDTNVGELDAAIDDRNNILVVWSDNRVIVNSKKRDDIYGRFFSFQTNVTAKNAVPESIAEINISDFDNYYDLATEPQVAVSDGWFLVVWTNTIPSEGSHIHAAAIDNAGTLRAPEFIMDSGETTNFCRLPSVAALAGNRFIVTWYDGINKTFWARWYDASEHLYLTDPIPLDQEFSIIRGTSVSVGNNNEFLFLWASYKMSRFDLTGFLGTWIDQGMAGKIKSPIRSGGSLQPLSVQKAEVKPMRAMEQKPPRAGSERSQKR
ncbi:MAG: hypothetical protein AB1656_23080 [Candidatus Omnitrophota bacterium]